MQNHPNTDPAVVAKLEQAQLDLLFDVRRPVSVSIESCELLTEELVVICRETHPRLGGSLNVEQFLSEQHVVLAIGDGSHTLLERIPGMQLIENRRIAARVNQYVAIPRLVEATDAIATLPRRMADYFMEREAIRILPFPFPGAIFDVFMAWHRSFNGDAAHTWLRDSVKELSQRL